MLTEKVDEPKWEALKGSNAEWCETRKMCTVIKCCAFNFIDLEDLAWSHWSSQYYYLWILLSFLIHEEITFLLLAVNFLFSFCHFTLCHLPVFLLLHFSEDLGTNPNWSLVTNSGIWTFHFENIKYGSRKPFILIKMIKMKETFPTVYFELHNHSLSFSYLCLIKIKIKTGNFLYQDFF